MGMYPHISEAVKKGEVLLEWDSKQGKAPVPLLKDVFGSERRKAKTLNFSIAYGERHCDITWETVFPLTWIDQQGRQLWDCRVIGM